MDPNPTHARINTACRAVQHTTKQYSLASTLSHSFLLRRATTTTTTTRVVTREVVREPTMGSFYETIQKKRFTPSMPLKDDLPISNGQCGDAAGHLGSIRRRISSFSVNIQPAASSASWAFRRTKSMPFISEFAGGPLRRWWEWGWGWILAKKPTFAQDLEMNEEETKMLGCHSRGSWRHVFYKVRSGIRELVRPSTLPTTRRFSYDSFNYAQNFDDGKKIKKGDE